MGKWVFRFGVLTIGLLVVLWFLGRPVAEHIVTGRIEAKAAQAGADIQWGPVQVDGLGVIVPDIRFQRQGIRMQVDRLKVQTNVRTAFGSPDWISAVEVRRPKLKLDLARRKKAEEREAVESVRRTSRRFIPERIPQLDIVEPHIEIRSPNGRERITVASPLVQIRPVSAGYRLGGVIRLQSEKWGSLVVKLSGLLDGEEKSFEVKLNPVDGQTSIVSIEMGSFQVHVGKASLKGQPQAKTGSLELVDVGVRFGRVRLEMDTLMTTFENGRMRIIGNGGQIIAQKRKTPAAAATAKMGQSQRPSIIVLPSQLTESFQKGLTVQWNNFTAQLPRIPRLTNGRLSIRQQSVDVSALAGGGRLNFEIDFNDGWTALQRGRFEIKGFQLAPLFAQRLPALPPGRSKRNRIDGGIDVDAEFVLADLESGLFQESEFLFQLDTNWSDGRIDVSSVSPDPVTEINISTRLEGAWNMLSDRIDAQGHLVMGAVDMHAKASVDDVRTMPLFKVRVDGKKIPCKDAYGSLPTGILGPYAGLKIAGWFQPYIRFRLPLVAPKDVLLRFKGFVRSCEVQALNADQSVYPHGHWHWTPASSA